MGTCVVKNGKTIEKKRRTESTLAPEKSMRQNISSIKDNNKSNACHYDQKQQQHAMNTSHGQDQQLQEEEEEDSQELPNEQNPKIKNQCINLQTCDCQDILCQRRKETRQYKSCFHNQKMEDDPITKIVLLEEACITLKHRMEQEKIKFERKGRENSGKKESQQLASHKTLNLSNAYIPNNTHQSTHPSFDQNNRCAQVSNEIHCYSTIIKLADYIQEKSQRLWEDPNDDEIHDAISSLFWASQMLQLDCLLEFKMKVSKHINISCDESLKKDQFNIQQLAQAHSKNQIQKKNVKNQVSIQNSL